jgi:S1-C subfamily serine protease
MRISGCGEEQKRISTDLCDNTQLAMSSVSQPDARSKLDEMGIPYTEASFLQYVALGDSSVVTLFLDAGMRPAARTPDGKTALFLASTDNHKEVAKILLARGADPLEALDAVHRIAAGKKKDVWDKLSALASVATIVSSLTIGLVGGWFTYSYNKRQMEQAALQASRDNALKEQQNRVAELDTIQKMVPYLTKDEDSKCVALLAINTLASPQVATQMATLYQGKGAVCALQKIAIVGDQQAKQQAVSALSNIAGSTSADKSEALGALTAIFENYKAGVVKVIGKTDQGDLESSGLVVTSSGYVLIPDYVAGAQFAGATVPKAHEFQVETFDGTKYPAALVDVNPSYKLGILQFTAPHLLPIALSSSAPSLGARVVMVAFTQDARGRVPLETTLRAQVGTVSSLDANFVTVVTSGDAAGGGGGPILNDKGEALGILHSGKQQRGAQLLFVRSDNAARYLRSKGFL